MNERESGMYKRMKKKCASVIILFTPVDKINFFFLALMNSAHLYVHCSNGDNNFRFSSTAGASF